MAVLSLEHTIKVVTSYTLLWYQLAMILRAALASYLGDSNDRCDEIA